MQAIVNWLEQSFGAIPLQLLEVWGRLSYFFGLAISILAFSGFTFRLGAAWGLGRERHAWNIKGFAAMPLTFVLVAVSGYLGSFIVLVPGAQTLESLKDLAVFLCVVLFGYPALVTVPFAYGLSDLIEGVPPAFLLDWLPGYFINPTCFWLAYQLIGKEPDFLRARTWLRYALFVLLFMSAEPVLWGYICSGKFTPEISYRIITPALWFTTSLTWLIAPFAMLGAFPLARRLGLFWAEIPGHVKERPLGSKDWVWTANPGQLKSSASAPGTQGLPLRMFILAPFIALILVLVGVTAYVSLRTAESDADRLAQRLHHEIAANIALRLDALSANDIDAGPARSSEAVDQLLRELPIAAHGRAFIIDRAGTTLASSAHRDDLVVFRAISSIKDQPGAKRARTATEFRFNVVTSRPLSRETWYSHVTSYRGRPSAGLDWLIVTALPEAYYLAGVRSGNSRSAMIFAVALLASLALAALLASLVTAPLRRISRATEALARGDLGQRVPNTRLEELDSLSMSFNDMAEQLRATFDDLLNEVETRKKRERELEASEARVRASESHLEDLVRERTLALERANRAKSTFLAHMSHEIRTPMNAVLGFGQLMDRDSDLSPRDRDRLRKILANGYHLLELINNVLEMSKIEAGGVQLHRETFDLHVAIQNVDAMVRATIEDKGLTFTVTGVSELPRRVRSDVAKIRQILINLLGNAAKFTRTGGVTLRAEARRQADQVTLRFEVEDTGIGIAENELEKVFVPFGQTESGIALHTGTGLGIPISRDYARLLGGDLRVQSRQGVGSTFEVELLVELDTTGPLVNEVAVGRVVGFEDTTATPKVMVVDDEPDNREVLRELLAGAGVHVIEAASGERAVELFAEQAPDLVFMDIKMPGMDGVEATRQIRALASGKSVPIVILSASVFDDQKRAVLRTGGTEFIAKPFREAEIWSAFERLLGLLPLRKTAPPWPEPDNHALTRDAVAALGSATVAALRGAVQLGYVQRVPSLLKGCEGAHPATVAALNKLADGLEIEMLLFLLDS